MVQKVKAYRVNKESLIKNRMPNYNDMCDGVTNIAPIKIRKIGSYAYHIAEDVKGDVYLIDNQTVVTYKLYDRNIGVSEVPYLLDATGEDQIKNYKKEKEELSLQQQKNEVQLLVEDTNESIKAKINEFRKNKKSGDKNDKIIK